MHYCIRPAHCDEYSLRPQQQEMLFNDSFPNFCFVDVREASLPLYYLFMTPITLYLYGILYYTILYYDLLSILWQPIPEVHYLWCKGKLLSVLN